MKGKAIVVTGGAGYIGSHVCCALTEQGYLPVSVDDMSSGHEWAVQWGPLVKGATSDPTLLAAILKEYEPVACIHMAAYIEVGESVKNPLKFYENNTSNTIQLLKALSAAPSVRGLVFSSTAAVYGEPQFSPITECHPLNPTSPYGWSKRFSEQVIEDQALAGGIPSVALRYFNAAGANVDAGIGEDHSPETHLIPNACLASLGMAPPLKIFGNDYDTPDGTAIRDYIHVRDLAQAHVRALEYLLSGGKTVSLNLGNGQGFSVREVVDAVSRRAGSEVPAEFTARRPGDVARLVADASQAKAVLGWKPQYPDIQTIVDSAYDWHLAHHAAKA